MRSVLLCLILCAPRAGAAGPVLAGRIDRVEAAGDLVAVVRDGEVRVLSGDGRPLLRLGSEDAPEPERARPGDGPDDVLEEREIPEEDRDSEQAEEAVEDEQTLRGRRAGHTPDLAPAARAPLLAASATELWIAVGLTLWRVDEDGRVHPVTTLERRFDHMAAGPDGRLLAAAGPHVWLSRDDGLTFDRLADADGPVQALAAGDGFLAWATARRATRVEIGRVVEQPLASPRDLRACGPTLLALDARGLVVLDANSRVLAAGRDARRIACGDGTWVLVGRRLLVSTDGGRRFSVRADLPPATPLAAAVGPRGLWVGTDVGLYDLPAREGRPVGVGVEAIGPPPAAPWAPYLPRLTIAASRIVAAGRDDLRAVAYADFPLAAPPTPPSPTQRLVQLVAEPGPAALPLPPDREAGCLRVARDQSVARALVEPERARSYVARAGHAAWLPELRVLMHRRLGRSESLDLPAGASVESAPLGLDTANDVRYEARATWDLSKLVFSTEEIAAVNAALRMADLRREVESLANRLYFERRRLKMEPTPIPATDARARRDLRVEELEAELDALSGGAFTRCLSAPP
jgi:hypothetical protein